MRRTCGLLLGVLVITGCQTGSTPQARHQQMDDASIAEAPMPTIDANTYVAAGDLAASRNEFAVAATQYENDLKDNPNDAVTIKKLALIYIKADQMPAAIDAWKRFVKATNGSAESYGSLGYAYELAGDPKNAEKTYQLGIADHPDGALPRVNYGLMLVRNNKVDEAVKQMSVVLQPEQVNYNIAGVYQQLGRRDLAEFYYRRAVECNPNFWAAKQRLATIDSN